MAVRTICNGDVCVIDYRCEATPEDAPVDECHDRFSLSYVRRGSFGYMAGARQFDLVAGGFLIGFPGDEFRCTHEHHVCGDECLSVQLSREAVDEFSARPEIWRVGFLPPTAGLGAVAEVAQAAIDGGVDVSPEEAGLMMVARFVDTVSPGRMTVDRIRPDVRRRMMRVADWLQSRLHASTSLGEAAHEAGMSPFHFLRSFRKVVGLTPHQYLVRLRLARAAGLLVRSDLPITSIALETGFEDLSNFIRTFRRATGQTPSNFRRYRTAGLERMEHP